MPTRQRDLCETAAGGGGAELRGDEDGVAWAQPCPGHRGTPHVRGQCGARTRGTLWGTGPRRRGPTTDARSGRAGALPPAADALLPAADADAEKRQRRAASGTAVRMGTDEDGEERKGGAWEEGAGGSGG
ncbi:hypothetical protein GQ55_2G234600 [Panicum hallii var. hallii]|uniref:Uncharacterized protein n=1 Tax=Panicum hallii var. hallii TaxID=1504633 RepID=A0A2T7ERN1_9POAL|nr:hypothetical protein GQ55_2G234600 [Panicum hallii var. hallii]